MKPSSTDSLSTSSALASLGRKMWSCERAARWLQRRRHGFPTTERGSSQDDGLPCRPVEVKRSPRPASELSAGLWEWRLTARGRTLGLMALEKWMNAGWRLLWGDCFFWCFWAPERWKVWQESMVEVFIDEVERGGGWFCKTLKRWKLEKPSNWMFSLGERRDGSLRLHRTRGNTN